MRWILFGATRGVGRALGRQLAERGDSLFLLGRDERELARAAADLEARGAPGPVGWSRLDLLDVARHEGALDLAWSSLGHADVVVLTAAEFAPQADLERDRTRLARLLDVDFRAAILFLEAARVRLAQQPQPGTLCAFGSVAGDRPRRPVVLYGAAKAGVAHYLRGVDLREWRRGVRTLLVKPGFVRTGMTAGLAEPPFAAEAETVARHVLRAVERRRRVLTTPPVWRWITAVVRALPDVVLRRTEF